MSNSLERGPKFSFLVLLFLLMFGFVVVIRPFLLSALLAAIVVVICHPIYQFLDKIFRQRRYLSALVSTLIALLCVIAPLVIAIAVIISNMSSIVAYVTSQLEAGQIAQALDNFNVWVVSATREYADYLPSDFNIRVALVSLLTSVGKSVYQYSPRVVSATANVVAGIFVMIVFIFVLFAEGGRIYQTIFSLLPLKDEHKQILAREVSGVVTGAFLGMLATSIAQGILIGIGFWIVGISNPFVWGLVAVGVTLVPVIGGPLMYVPASMIFLIGGKIGAGVFLLAYGLGVVSVVDNIIKPIVMRGKVKIHPLLLALGLIGGGLMLGPAGVVIGPLIVALMLACLKIYQREFVEHS